MNIFDEYTFDLLDALLKNDVQFIVVGGYAVNFHGYRRTTGDIDLWIKPDNFKNKTNIIKCFRKLLIEEDILIGIQELDFSNPVLFIDGEEPFKIDFMTFVSGVTFDDAWEQKIIANVDGLNIPFIHFNHLILTKISTGRPKDSIDIEQLQKIHSKKTD
jgi:predicted nucleotidyltransferase